MSEPVSVRIDHRTAVAEAGSSVAAALENAGERVCRRSVCGEGRGVLCAMGICFECRVTIDGVAHRRACMELCRDGMVIETGEVRPQVSGLRSQASSFVSLVETESIECDVAVVGGGPAGVAAACRVAESGAKTVVLDEGATPGGQIHRHRPNREPPEAARPWLDRLARSRAIVRSATSVFDAVRRAAGWRLCAEGPGGTCRIDAGALVLATGARELFLPFPGWTLPGVMGAGGAQALWKSGGSIRGRTAVVAGSGPLLLAVGASLARAGANVAVVAEQARRGSLLRFAGGLVRFPGKLVEAARYRAGFFAAAYRAGTWVAEARGGGRLESVALTDGVDRFEIRCDIAAIGYGLVPNTELPRLLGCEIRGGTVVVDSRQQTSVPGVFCAGEPCGVAGLDVAVAEGELAGLAAAGHAAPSAEARRLSATRSRGRRLAVVMDATFRPREELRSLARADTIVCRCEDVRLAALAPFAGIREAKLSTRAGMGPCQGRVCGPALAFLFGWDSDTVRPPIKPVALGSLLQEDSA